MTLVHAIRLIEKEAFEEIKDQLLLRIPENSRERVLSYKKVMDQQRTLFGELLIRAYATHRLGLKNNEIHLIKEEKGKPVLKGFPHFHFNISHSGDWVVSAFASTPVGIDIEKIGTPNLNLAARFYSEQECEDLLSKPAIHQPDYFYSIWTGKESYLKATGKGITIALNSLNFIFDGEQFLLDSPKTPFLFSHMLIDKDYKLCVCSEEWPEQTIISHAIKSFLKLQTI